MEIAAAPDVQGQRHGARHRRQPARLRAGLELPRPASAAVADASSSRSTTRGKYLNSPNDVVTRGSDGSIYFTDPDYGRWNDWIGQRARAAISSASAASTACRRAAASSSWSSTRTSSTSRTACASRRTRSCSTSTTRAARNVKVFDVAADGTLGTEPHAARRHRQRRRRARATSTAWSATSSATSGSTGPGGVWVLTPEGDAPRRRRDAGGLRQPRVGWRSDLRTLFLTTTTTVHVVTTLVGPAPLPPF